MIVQIETLSTLLIRLALKSLLPRSHKYLPRAKLKNASLVTSAPEKTFNSPALVATNGAHKARIAPSTRANGQRKILLFRLYSEGLGTSLIMSFHYMLPKRDWC